jgi:hypothetical protein
MKQSNPQRIAVFRERLDTLSRLFRAGRFNPRERQDRIRELDALRWAIPILERHTKESFEAQEAIERRADDAPAQ